MQNKIHLVILTLSLLFFKRVLAWSVLLDKDTDLFQSWKLEGNYEYYQTGVSLRTIHDLLPEQFDFEAVKNTKGIWGLLPESGNDWENSNETSTILFRFTSSAQLIASVDITYCLYGNVSIALKNAPEKPSLYIIKPNDAVTLEFVTLSIPINPANRFVIEGNVTGGHDFILIDRIRANFMEVTTPKPRPKSTTTANPNISPACCVHHFSNLHAFVLLVGFVLWRVFYLD